MDKKLVAIARQSAGAGRKLVIPIMCTRQASRLSKHIDGRPADCSCVLVKFFLEKVFFTVVVT
jgi:hypothetical protein